MASQQFGFSGQKSTPRFEEAAYEDQSSNMNVATASANAPPAYELGPLSNKTALPSYDEAIAQAPPPAAASQQKPPPRQQRSRRGKNRGGNVPGGLSHSAECYDGPDSTELAGIPLPQEGELLSIQRRSCGEACAYTYRAHKCHCVLFPLLIICLVALIVSAIHITPHMSGPYAVTMASACSFFLIFIFIITSEPAPAGCCPCVDEIDVPGALVRPLESSIFIENPAAMVTKVQCEPRRSLRKHMCYVDTMLVSSIAGYHTLPDTLLGYLDSVRGAALGLLVRVKGGTKQFRSGYSQAQFAVRASQPIQINVVSARDFTPSRESIIAALASCETSSATLTLAREHVLSAETQQRIAAASDAVAERFEDDGMDSEAQIETTWGAGVEEVPLVVDTNSTSVTACGCCATSKCLHFLLTYIACQPIHTWIWAWNVPNLRIVSRKHIVAAPEGIAIDLV